jgi:signal transduction histidine kinase
MWERRRGAIVGPVQAHATAAARCFWTKRAALELGLPVAIAVLAQAETWTSNASAKPALALLALATTVPLVWLRSHPLLVFAVVMGAAFVLAVTDALNPLYVLLATTLTCYATAAYLELALGLGALVTTLCAFTLVDLLAPWQRGHREDVLLLAFTWGGAWALGRALRSRTLHAARLEDRTVLLEREREEKARAAVVEERARIARELHDVVAHSVSLMLVQTGVARRRIRHDRPEESELLREVEEIGRGALAEMRRLLGILRTSDDALSIAPQPGLARLPALLEQAREAGVPVELLVEGEESPLPPGLDLAAFRVVQEALTNVRKHAGPAAAEVVIRYRARALELEISDDGHRVIVPADGSGQGLVGMRERVALYGGTLETGPRDQGGFRVRVRLLFDGESL